MSVDFSDPRVRYWITMCALCCLALTPGKAAVGKTDAEIMAMLASEMNCDVNKYLQKNCHHPPCQFEITQVKKADSLLWNGRNRPL